MIVIGPWFGGGLHRNDLRRLPLRLAMAAGLLTYTLAMGVSAGAKSNGPSEAGMESCKSGGWVTQGFGNQGECVSFYARGGTTTSTTTTTTTTSTPTSTSTSTTTTTTTTIPQGSPSIALAFVDTTVFPFIPPSPWAGDPGVVFVGCLRFDPACSEDYVAGAIRIINSSGSPLTLMNATVEVGPCHYQPWGALLPVTAGPGGSIILTQSGTFGPPQPDACDAGVSEFAAYWNFLTNSGPFDSAEPPFYNCDRTLVPPAVINLTFSDGRTLTITDTNEILTTGGINERACSGENQPRPWTSVPATDIVSSPG